MKKIQKNIIILICAALLVILLMLASFFQDSLIHIVTQVWSGLNGEIKVEESMTQNNRENDLCIEESMIQQEEDNESRQQTENLDETFEDSTDSMLKGDSDIQIFPNITENENSSGMEIDSQKESDDTKVENSQVPEESDGQNGNSKLTEFPITPF